MKKDEGMSEMDLEKFREENIFLVKSVKEHLDNMFDDKIKRLDKAKSVEDILLIAFERLDFDTSTIKFQSLNKDERS